MVSDKRKSELILYSVSSWSERDVQRYKIAEIEANGNTVFLLSRKDLQQAGWKKKFENNSKTNRIFLSLHMGPLPAALQFWILSQDRISWGYWIPNPIPESINKALVKGLFGYSLSQLRLRVRSIIVRLAKILYFAIFRPNLFIYGGNALLAMPECFMSKRQIAGVSCDWSLAKESLSDMRCWDDETDCEFAVFLDEYEPYHPDRDLLKNYSGVLPENGEYYFSELSSFFDSFEKFYKVPVIIAAHPKSSYERGNEFEKRSVIFDRTRELILSDQCKLVLIHKSTAVSFAVIARKPIVFLDVESGELDYRAGIHNLANQLDGKVITVDEAVSGKLLQFNQMRNVNAYQGYIKEYLCSTMSNDKKVETAVLEALSIHNR